MKPKLIPADALRAAYVDDQRTMADIAAEYGCTQATVRTYLLKYDIPIRPKSEAQRLRNTDPSKRNQGLSGFLNAKYRHGGYVQERIYRQMIAIELCNRCGASDKLVVHHKNGDHYDNHPENLEVLCRSCHQSHHKSEYWEARRKG